MLCKPEKLFCRTSSREVGKSAGTLVYLIIVQDVINVQAGKFPEINKRAGCNKAVQVGIFQKSIVKKPCRLENFLKLINVQDVIRPCRLYFFQKLIRTCSTFIR